MGDSPTPGEDTRTRLKNGSLGDPNPRADRSRHLGGDPETFQEMLDALAVPQPDRQDEVDGPYRLEAVVGRVREADGGFQAKVEFVVRIADGTGALWGNGGDWSEVFSTPNVADAQEHELDQFWGDVGTGGLDMRAEPDPPPVFWYGVDEASRAALKGL
ncbi:MAG: hypothetical protein JHC95_03245 [Solirubrobacteraceae bacterium]|nr:hypothetical protein [Solirubrobacteraceae bacterium]